MPGGSHSVDAGVADRSVNVDDDTPCHHCRRVDLPDVLNAKVKKGTELDNWIMCQYCKAWFHNICETGEYGEKKNCHEYKCKQYTAARKRGRDRLSLQHKCKECGSSEVKRGG